MTIAKAYQVDPKLLGQYEKLMAKEMKLAVQSGLRKAAKEVKTLLVSGTRAVDRGTYRDSWKVEAAWDHLNITNTAPHAIYVEAGRRAGARMPPVAVIAEWLMRRGKDAKLAFVVARAIGIRGIRGRPRSVDAYPMAKMIIWKQVHLALRDLEMRAAYR